MRVVKFIVPLVIVAAGLGVFRYLTVTAEPPAPLRPQERAPVVSVRAADKVTASPTARVFGAVESPTTSVLTAGVEGDVVEVAALEGDAVERGQLLIELDAGDAELQLRQRRAELADLEAQLESEQIKRDSDRAALAAEEELLALRRKAAARAERLARSRAGSEAALDQARQDQEGQRLAVIARRQAIDDYPARRRQLMARRARAEAAVAQAGRDLARARISAPFAGRVTRVFASAGERVGVGAQLLELYDESQLELRAQVPSSHLPALQLALAAGESVTATALDGGGDAKVELVLHRLSAQVAAGRGGSDAFFRAQPASAGRLPLPGNTVEINLKLPPLENVVLLSPDSLYGRARIYLVRDDALRAKSVRRLGRLSRPSQRGQPGDGRGEIQLIVAGDDFDAGDLILDSRLPQAIDGLKVRVAQ